MRIPPAELNYIATLFRECIRPIVERFQDSDLTVGAEKTSPDLLAVSMEQLLDMLHEYGEQTAVSQESLTSLNFTAASTHSEVIQELGDYGQQLLLQLSNWAARLDLEEEQETLEQLSFPLALWIANQGAELQTLEPIVNTLANLANQSHNLATLENLFESMGQIVNSVSVDIIHNYDNSEPLHPWRLLLLNHAIVATRTCKPSHMEQAFNVIIECLPEDAPGFFREGVEQMDVMGYPEPVRLTMEKYFQEWGRPKLIH